MAIEIVDLPSYNMVDLSIVLLVYQRVIIYIYIHGFGVPLFQKTSKCGEKKRCQGGGYQWEILTYFDLG